jgi:hypothetical protein
LIRVAELQGTFNAEKAASYCKVTSKAAKKYLRILDKNGLVKVVSRSPLTYIFSGSPLYLVLSGLEEEVMVGLRLLLEPLLRVVTKAIDYCIGLLN